MLRLLAILILIPLCRPADAEGPFDRPIRQLSDADPEKAARAHRMLLRRGTPALEALRRARDASTDKQLRERIAGIVAEIERREPHGLRFGAGVPKMRLTTAYVNSKAFQFVISVKNQGGEPVILWPYLSLRVLDGTGNELKRSTRIGRHGLRRTNNRLEDVEFVTIEPGRIWSVRESLVRYTRNAASIDGWKVPGPGTYTLELTYHFDRAAEKKRCDPDWERLDGPDEPWNRARAFRHTFTTQMRVD